MVKMFAREAREMSYDTEDIIDTFLMRVQEPEPPSEMKRLMKKMVGRLSDAKIRREFCEDIMNIKEHVKDLVERRARYSKTSSDMLSWFFFLVFCLYDTNCSSVGSTS